MGNHPRHLSTSAGNHGIPFVSRKDPDVKAVDKLIGKALWEFADRIRMVEGAIIYVAMGIRLSELKTCFGIPLVPDTKGERTVDLVFIDQEPDANWAHDCAYVLAFSDGHIWWIDAEWSPCTDVHMKLRQYTDSGRH